MKKVTALVFFRWQGRLYQSVAPPYGGKERGDENITSRI